MQPLGWYIGHLGRIPVHLDPSVFFLALLAFMWGGGGLEGTVLILIALVLAILFHELGHGWVASALKMDGVAVVIGGLGGFCTYTGLPSTGRKVMISLAGPMMNGVLAGVAFLILAFLPGIQDMMGGLVANLLILLIYVNVALGIFNLLPVYPLDGGQAFHAIASRFARNQDAANRVTLTVTVIAAVGAFLAYTYWWRGGQPSLFTFILILLLVMSAHRTLSR